MEVDKPRVASISEIKYPKGKRLSVKSPMEANATELERTMWRIR